MHTCCFLSCCANSTQEHFQAVHVAVKDVGGITVEQYTFEVGDGSFAQCKHPKADLHSYPLQVTFQSIVDVPCTGDDLLQSFAASVTKLLQSNTHMGPPQTECSFTIMMQLDPAYGDLSKLLPTVDSSTAAGASHQHSGFWSRVSSSDPEAAALVYDEHDESTMHLKRPHTLMKVVSAGTMSMQVAGYRARGAS
jgi:hypothetical protein